MAYVQLFLGIAIEVAATSLLKVSNGFSRPLPTLACLVGYGLSFWLVAQSVRTLPLGYVYAIWSGVGTVAVAVISAIAYSEGLGPLKVLGIGCVILGIVVLNLASAS